MSVDAKSAERLNRQYREGVSKTGIEEQLKSGQFPGIHFLSNDSNSRETLKREKEEHDQSDNARCSEDALTRVWKGRGIHLLQQVLPLRQFIVAVDVEYEGH